MGTRRSPTKSVILTETLPPRAGSGSWRTSRSWTRQPPLSGIRDSGIGLTRELADTAKPKEERMADLNGHAPYRTHEVGTDSWCRGCGLTMKAREWPAFAEQEKAKGIAPCKGDA